MLEARNVRKAFGGWEVLKGIDLQVENGEVIAILGPSGSGKTTLLRCLNFLERADGGELVFDGERFDLHSASRREVASKKAGEVAVTYAEKTSAAAGASTGLSDLGLHLFYSPVLF